MMSFAERFWSKTRLSENGCIEWTAATSRLGYGSIGYAGKTVEAHRAAWFMAYGEWSSRPHRQLLHACDNRRCVNVTHMRIGTQMENIRDRQERGRQARGSAHVSAKLCQDRVTWMREIHRDLHMTIKNLARLFGVSPRAARSIVNGETWAHVPFPAREDTAA